MVRSPGKLVLIGLAAGILLVSNPNVSPAICNGTPCCSEIQSITIRCLNGDCNGSATFNAVCLPPLYGDTGGTLWILSVDYCCGLVAGCSADWPAGQCSGEQSQLEKRRSIDDPVLAAATRTVYVRGCAGQYVLLRTPL